MKKVVIGLIILINLIVITAVSTNANTIGGDYNSIITIGQGQNNMTIAYEERPKSEYTPIVELRKYLGEKVKIKGHYLGFKIGYGSQPITKSDWLVQDDTGEIYVSGEVWDRKSPCILEGTVRMNDVNLYLEVERKGRR